MKIGTFDIHSHLLPGVDDGFKTAEESLQAISWMVEAGCRDIVFTPHINPDVYPDSSAAVVKDAYDKFVKLIPAELGVKTSLAAEYMVVKDFEKMVEEDSKSLMTYGEDSVPGSSSILIEMSYYFKSSNLKEVVFALGLAGLSPILAHPERYAYMAEDLHSFNELRDMGCRFQSNYLSLTGVYGPSSIAILRYLKKNGFCDFFSSDLHSLTQLKRIQDSKPVLPLRWTFRKDCS